MLYNNSMFYEVLPTKLFRQNSSVLTYHSDLNLKPGQIVSIPLGRSTTIGIVWRRVKSVDFPTKPIHKLIVDSPLPKHILQSIDWLHHYYLAPLPQAANLFLPNGITKRRRTKATKESPKKIPFTNLADWATTIPLNSAQRQAIKSLVNVKSSTRLLHGVTGSGKTNIYLALAHQTLKNNQSVILLVPEIALTSQLVEIFEQTFSNQTILMHSKQTEAERHLTWEKILNSTEPLVIIGPRSALLAPLHNLGLIIIDESHEPTYCQENSPKYSALRLASFMAQTLKVPCIQGTATPLVADYYLAQQKKALVSLATKAKRTAVSPQVHVIDFKDRQNFTKNRYFSNQLLQNIEQNLNNGHQTLLFHNRRGSAPLTLCEHCGWQAVCLNCYLPFTLHADTYELICHTCGAHQAVPKTCPTCNHPEIIHKGFGTKLLETELGKIFKNARIARFDSDNLKSETLSANFSAVRSGEIDIVIGTQTIARGLDLPNLATVGVVQADSGLSLPDYAAEERTFHLLTQVMGRVGRGHLKEAQVFLQTFQPEHPVISAAITNDYVKFANHLLSKRAKGHFPPFNYLAKVTITFKTERTTITKIRNLQTALASIPGLVVSTPMPTFHEQSRQGYTWQLILKSTSRQTLLSALNQLPAGAHFTIDPPSLL